MTPLREKMIRDMQLYRLAKSTQDSYLRSVAGLAKYYKKSPDKIDEDELKRYILYLANERGLRWSSIDMMTLRDPLLLFKDPGQKGPGAILTHKEGAPPPGRDILPRGASGVLCQRKKLKAQDHYDDSLCRRTPYW